METKHRTFRLLKPGTNFINIDNTRGIIINTFKDDKNLRYIRVGLNVTGEKGVFREHVFRYDDEYIYFNDEPKYSLFEYFKYFGDDEINARGVIDELYNPYKTIPQKIFTDKKEKYQYDLYEKINEMIRAINEIRKEIENEN